VTQEYRVRPATAADVETIVAQRRAMIADMGEQDQARLDAMAAEALPWLERNMADGDYLTWLAVAPDGSIAAGVGLWLMEWPPTARDLSARRGMILNVYTAPEHRRRGLARRLVETTLDWCRANGIQIVILHASDDGRPLYVTLGFQPTNEMRLLLGDQ
jgi:GNAT superfamily N-acetyltransferase